MLASHFSLDQGRTDRLHIAQRGDDIAPWHGRLPSATVDGHKRGRAIGRESHPGRLHAVIEPHQSARTAWRPVQVDAHILRLSAALFLLFVPAASVGLWAVPGDFGWQLQSLSEPGRHSTLSGDRCAVAWLLPIAIPAKRPRSRRFPSLFFGRVSCQIMSASISDEVTMQTTPPFPAT